MAEPTANGAHRGEVIVAPATPAGRSAIAVIRVSGPGAHEIARAVARPVAGLPLSGGRPRHVRFHHPEDGNAFDDGVAWLAAGPRTATGEDIAELSCHGNPLIVDRLLDALLAAGARLAHPGEFTRRAVEHGRLDLAAAEGVGQLIDARSLDGVLLAREAVEGRLSSTFVGLRDRVIDVLAGLEARLDYPEDDLGGVLEAEAAAALRAVGDDAAALAGTWRAGHVAVDGARVALVGGVNAGKSSLFNALLGRARALVHPSAGTTRDVLEVATTLAGLPVTLLDTAGERPTEDPVEAAGLALARELVAEADLLVVVLRARPGGPDATEREILARTADRPRLVVLNGVDEVADAPVQDPALRASARTGEGVAALAQAVAAALRPEVPRAVVAQIASVRQRDVLVQLAQACEAAAVGLEAAGPAVAIELAHEALSEVDALTGSDAREDVLDRVFTRFCLGK